MRLLGLLYGRLGREYTIAIVTLLLLMGLTGSIPTLSVAAQVQSVEAQSQGQSSVPIVPSTAADSTARSPTRTDYQGHTCYANGRFWIFYNNGTSEGWVSSPDGILWSPETDFTTLGIPQSYSAFYCSGSNLYYVNTASTEGSGMYYRYGSLNSNGTITWSIKEGFFMTNGSVIRGVSTTLDSNGGWWIAFGSYNPSVGSGLLVEVWYCATPSSCDWTTSTIISISGSQGDFVAYPDIVPLSGGKMAVVWGNGPSVTGTIGIETFDGSSWSPQVLAPGVYKMDASACASVQLTVECGVDNNTTAVGYISASYSGTGNPTWSDFTALASCSSSVNCSASMSTVEASPGSTELYMAFTKSIGTVGYFESSDSGATWGDEVDISTSETNASYVSTPTDTGAQFIAVWTSCSNTSCSSFREVRFAAILSSAQLVQALRDLSNQYLELNQEYLQLVSSSAALNSEFQELISQYASLSRNYSSLSQSFASISTEYQELNSQYTSLSQSNDNLSRNYDNMSTEYQEINSQYVSLSRNYANLLSDYNQISNQLARFELFTYLLAAALAVVVGLSFWLLTRRRPAAS